MTLDEIELNTQNDSEVNQTEPTAEVEPPKTIAEANQRANQELAQEALDLSKAEKFVWKGKEYSVNDLENWRRSELRQSDYTKKTQALAEREKALQAEYEAKYEPYKKYSGENLLADLMTIKKNPELIPQFKEIYGEKYLGALDLLGLTNQEKQELKQEVRTAGLDPDTQAKINEVLSLGETLKQREAQAMEAELDARFSEYGKKFPDVDEELAMVKLEAIAAKKGTLEPDDFERVYKSINDRFESSFQKKYSSLVNSQKQKNINGADVPSGGGIPGQAPKNPRTIKEASALALQAMQE